MSIPFSGSRVFHSDRQTIRCDEAFRNFANAPNKIPETLCVSLVFAVSSATVAAALPPQIFFFAGNL